jgi:hypothetical protein
LGNTQTSKGIIRALQIIVRGFNSRGHNFALVLGAIVLAGGGALIFSINNIYLPVFAVAIVWYATMFLYGWRQSDAAEAALVAEQIVALGVASLIFHVALAGFDLHAAWLSNGKFTGDQIWPAATRFGEGLICATLAPLVAMWVRSSSYERAELGGQSGGAGGEVVEAAAIGASASGAIGSANSQIAARVREYDLAIQRLVTVTQDLASQLEKTSAKAGSSLQALLSKVDAELLALSGSVGIVANDLEKRTVGLGSAIGGLTNNVGRLTASMSESFSNVADEVRAGGGTLRRSLEDAGVDVRASGKALSDDFRIISASVAEHGRSVAQALQGMSGALEKQFASLGQSFEELEKQLQSIENGLSAVGQSASKVSNDLPRVFEAATAGVSSLRAEMARLGDNVGEGALLLEGLRDLVGSVRRFIPSDAEAPVSPTLGAR